MMFRKTLLIAGLLGLFQQTFAQLPNGNFENWKQIGNYQDPEGWATTNQFVPFGTVFPVSRSADHGPNSSGAYSIKIQSDKSVGAYGITMTTTGDIMEGPKPTFAIQGHPTTVSFSYKYLPKLQDSMYVAVLLYKNGAIVSGTEFRSGELIQSWKDMTLNLDDYTSADSGAVILSAYQGDGPPPGNQPKGNSVLYIDDLRFTGFSSVSAITKKGLEIYPNPVKNELKIKSEIRVSKVFVYNSSGSLVMSKELKGAESLDVRELKSGTYFVRINDENSEMYKMIKTQD